MIETIRNSIKNKLVKNILTLLTGDGVVSIIGIVNLIIILQTIGMEDNGKIIIAQTYCMLFNDIFNFQSFNAIIKYLSSALEKNDLEKARLYIKQAYILDIFGAFIATVFGYVFVNLTASILEWDSEIKILIYLYMISVLFNIKGASIGILRYFNKYKSIVLINVSVSFIKLFFYLFGYFYKADIIYFIIVETISSIIPQVLIILWALRVTKNNKLDGFATMKLKFDKNFLWFNFYNNLVLTIDIPRAYLSTFLVNKFLGLSETSVLKIIEKLCSLLSKFNGPINQVVYPELAKLVANKQFEKARVTTLKIAFYVLIIGAIVVGFLVISQDLWVDYIFDKNINYSSPLLLALIVALLSTASVSTHNLFTAYGLVKYDAIIAFIVNSLFIAFLLFSVRSMGLLGVYIANGFQIVTIVALKWILIKYFYNKEKKVLVISGGETLR